MDEDPRAERRSDARRPWWSRPGVPTLALAGVLAVASVVITVSISYPTGLGVMLLLATLYVVTLYVAMIGVLSLRAADDGDRTAPGAGRPWMCHVVDHRYVLVPGRADAVEHWRCGRCGKRRYTAPLSAGETLSGTRVDQRWIRRGDQV